MKLPASSSRLLLDGSRSSSSTCRSFHSCAPAFEAWHQASSSNSSSNPSKKSQRFKRNNETQKQNKVTDTILTASRLGRHADSIDKSTSDRYSGWKPTPGPSARRNVGRPKLSRDAGKSLARAKDSASVETLLGVHSAGVLLQPLLQASGGDDGFGASGLAGSITSRDFIAPRRNLKPGDFVEVRRAGTDVGIVLPPPGDVASGEQETHRTSSGMRDLYVLVTSGQIVLHKDNDVMMQIPSVIEPILAQTAAATSKQYVVSSNSLDSPVNSDGSHDAHSFASAGESDPIEGTAMQEEPIDIPRFEARASICNKLRILERQKEKELQRLLPSFQSLFLVDAASQKEGEAAKLRNQRMDLRTGTITTFEAARLMHELHGRRAKSSDREDLTASTVYAAHALLMSHPTHFVADVLSHRTSQLFTCRSERERSNLALVSGWMAGPPGSEGQSFIDAFCRKASKIREYSEAIPHDASGPPRIIDPPSNKPDLDFTWTTQDKAIIEFLQASLGSRREVQENTHTSLAINIVKRAGGHFRLLPHPDSSDLMDVDRATQTLLVEQGGTLGRSMLETVGTDVIAGSDLLHALVMRFLVSIGALPPWQNPIRLDTSFRSATMGEDGGEPEREPTASGTEESSNGGRETVAKKFGLTLDDQIEALRYDFGHDHTVYVIDDEGAFELDDGISIEPVKGADQAWVHIHIADPTAWIQPDDELGQRAERRFQTLYFPEARWAMLPDDFVRSGVGLRSSSTGENGNSRDGQRVMSFSALVDLSSGLVQDTKIRPALIHDVQTTSYREVSSLLANPSASSPTAKSYDLSQLLQIATKLSENRTKGSAFLAYRPSSTVTVSQLPLPGVPVSASQLHRPYFFAGFPTISVAPNADRSGASGVPALAQFVVSEMMILAGRIAAGYGKEHDLAFAYRYQLRPDSLTEAEELLAMRVNLPPTSTSVVSVDGIIGHGLIGFDSMIARGLSVSAGGYSARPEEHFSLGISADASSPFAPKQVEAIANSGYLRATSPLRRYPDMLAHWQIKHHLVHQQARFHVNDVERILPQLERQEVSAKQWMRASERFWLHLLLQQRLLRGQQLMDTMTARVALSELRVNTGTLSGRVRVNIEELGLPADLEWPARETAPDAGEVFAVKPVAVAIAGIRSGLTVRRV